MASTGAGYAPRAPYSIVCIPKSRAAAVVLALMMSRESDVIGSGVPDNQVWVLIVDKLEIAIQTLDRFRALCEP